MSNDITKIYISFRIKKASWEKSKKIALIYDLCNDSVNKVAGEIANLFKINKNDEIKEIEEKLEKFLIPYLEQEKLRHSLETNSSIHNTEEVTVQEFIESYDKLVKLAESLKQSKIIENKDFIKYEGNYKEKIK